MTQYIIAGLVSGSIYALAALGLVSTYLSAGVLNFAYGAYAFFAARLYFYLHVEQGWGILPAAALVILVVSPLAGLVLWALLFRGLARSPTLVKVAATIGLSVAIPPAAQLLFGKEEIYGAPPGLAPRPVDVYHPFGVAMTLDQVIVIACLVAVLAVGAFVLRFTNVGLVVRAVVDSETMTTLTGVNPQVVSAGVWSVSFVLSGLAGILVAPTLGLQSDSFTLLTATAFTAVVIARMRFPGRAVVVALLIGVATALVRKWAPADSSLADKLIPSVPFIFVVLFILLGSRQVREPRGEHETALGVALAREDERRARRATGARRGPLGIAVGNPGAVAAIVAVLVLPAVLNNFWLGLVASGLVLGIAMLSFTLVTGEGGFISLAQVSFAGLGAAAVGQLTAENGFSPLLALVCAGAVALLLGLLVGVLTVRLGDLYIAVITLTFGLLLDSLVFRSEHFYRSGAGVDVARPSFASGDVAFAYFALVVFALLALFVVNLRRSTTGLGVVAGRWSVPGARTLGLNTTALRALLVGVGAGVAAIGGGMLAMYQQASLLDSFATPIGLIWLTVAVAVGIRSVPGAAAAGLSLTVIPGLVTQYLPASWTPVPTLLFGLAAIGMVRQPDGMAADLGSLADRVARGARLVFGRGAGGTPTITPSTAVATVPVAGTDSEPVSTRPGGAVGAIRGGGSAPREKLGPEERA
ncbi:ABC transporter permease [Parafrankia elaeagni]|uniref:ABC transporter permease n=1 Tax=Parafrankia elaeagni TaxID=222534 RepID=UPI00035CEC53|nr:ABC transporter permease [Parafrankia elaeagni]